MYEKKKEEIISPKHENPITRIARFLKPNARNVNQITEIPLTPFVYEVFSNQNLQKWPINVQFSGWKKPQKNWVNWVNRLVVNFATCWIESGIIDGIQGSIHEIPCNYELVLGICEFWCEKTSSFVFPWGEATITLEDVMILGGLPVVGEEISKGVEGNLGKIGVELRRVKREIAQKGENGEKGVSHSAWLQHFMEEEEEGEIEHEVGEFEHVAFLCLWLSRFVFPDFNEGLINDYVFDVAIHLSQGTKLALAPVVLANLYHELTLLSQNAVDLRFGSKYYVCGLFKIVQLWVCERFPDFGAKLCKPLGSGDPRVARWDNVVFEVSLSDVRARLKAGEGFRWRPYGSDLENWDYLPFYGELEQTFLECAVLDDCLLSYGRFLCSAEISGYDRNCREKYQPHRVAMQFGYDQDIPGQFRVSAVYWKKVGLYIPSRTFDPGVSRYYYNWWKDSILRHEEAVSEHFRPKRGKDNGKRLIERQEVGTCNIEKSASASPQLVIETCENKCGKSNASSDLDHIPLASRSCSDVANKNAAKFPQIQTTGHHDLIGRKGIPEVEAKKCQLSESLDNDIDHVPLYLRLQSIGRKTETHKSLESYASTEDVGNTLLGGKNQPEEVASQKSDADSNITRKDCSMEKTVEADREVKDNASGMPSRELLTRVEKLERAIAILGAGRLKDAEFFTE